MIEIKRTVKCLSGKSYLLGEDSTPQIWQVAIRFDSVDSRGFASGNAYGEHTRHIEREHLERAGVLPAVAIPKEEHASETVEDLLVRVLEELGVSFEE